MTSPSEPLPRELKRGRYTLLRALGAGSQGETYEGRDNGAASERPSPDRLREDFERYVERARAGATPCPPRGLVAIKCFRVGKAKAWKDVELAEREARTLAALDHPRLPKYLEHFEEDGTLYLVMEKIDGESLAALRARRGVMTAADVTRMLEQIGDALRYLHGLAPPVVHRDIKPGNIIRKPDGSFALVDFGAVRDRLKPAGGSTVVGTFGYMAPEQFQGRASGKADVYGLGATALAMLTGVEPEDLPHQGLAVDVARAVPDGTPAGLVRALAAMLAPDPDARAASVDDALAAMRTPPEATPAPRGAPPTRGDRRRDRERGRASPKREEAPADRRREAREARRARRALRRSRRAPLLARLFAKLGLLVATVTVWVTVGLVAPLVLTILSLLFGPALRRAATACFTAAKRSTAAMHRASRWLSGHRDGDEHEGREPHAGDTPSLADHARVRVSATDPRIRVESVAAHDSELDDLDEDVPAGARPARHGRSGRDGA